jgi:hypothetical protein
MTGAMTSRDSAYATGTLGGGVSAEGNLLLAPVRELLTGWLPYPPRVEVSSLGDAAVLTGALAVGVRQALDDVFVDRARA